MKPVKNEFHLDFPVSLQEEFAGVVAQAVVEPSRDIESLRGRMGESTRHPGNERRGRCGRVV